LVPDELAHAVERRKNACYGRGVAINSTRPDYDAVAPQWSQARDVLSGEDAVKAAGEKYLPRMECQSEEDYAAYKARASFFGAMARTLEEYLDLVFRRSCANAPSPQGTHVSSHG
jgi:hypothetical protein